MLGGNAASMRDDIIQIVWPEIMARHQGLIASLNFGPLRPMKKLPTGGLNPSYEADKVTCKNNALKFNALKNAVVAGIGNVLLKLFFPTSLPLEKQAEFNTIAQQPGATTASKVRGKFMKEIRQWWMVNRVSLINDVSNKFKGKSLQGAKAQLFLYAYFGEPGNGWANTSGQIATPPERWGVQNLVVSQAALAALRGRSISEKLIPLVAYLAQ